MRGAAVLSGLRTVLGVAAGASQAPWRPRRVWAVRVSWEDRDRASGVTVVAVAGLAVGVLLAVLGLPPVDLHAPPHQFGIMDPLCGGTRALRFTLLGHWHDAWRYNPLSPVLAVGAALALLRHMVGALTGRWLTIWIPRRVLIALAVIVLVPLEVNQQLHAGLLQGP
ncbi:MAG: DUF2752 domain-containing protein [Actinoallomurus sp.]